MIVLGYYLNTDFVLLVDFMSDLIKATFHKQAELSLTIIPSVEI